MKPILLVLSTLLLALALTFPAGAPPEDSGLPVQTVVETDEGPLVLKPNHTVNAVLGDESFVATFGRQPGPRDSEALRLRTHLRYVEGLLRARDVSHLSPELQAARVRNLDRLRDYWTAGVSPKNTVFRDRRTPVFIDEAGRICAVGYLVAQDLGREAAEAIDREHHLDTVFEIDSPVLAAWLATSGLTLREAGMIQPFYGPNGMYRFSFTTDGPTACGTNENLSPEILSEDQISLSDMRRDPSLQCEAGIDDAMGTTGFGVEFDATRSIRYDVTYDDDRERPIFNDFSFIVWRSPDGPTELRLMYSINDRGEYYEEARIPVSDVPTEHSIFFDFSGEGPDWGAEMYFTIEARGGTPDGILYLDEVSTFPGYTPVELTRFEGVAEGDAVHLAWETASETNNAGFEVQVDGGAGFAIDGFVEGYGTTEEVQQYAYTAVGLEPGTYRFRLKQVDYDGAFEFSDEIEVAVSVPGSYLLTEAYPNPFNPQTSFSLSVAETQHVRLVVFDALGRRVTDLFDGRLEGGQARPFRLDARNLASGLLVIRAVGETFAATRTVTLLR